MNDLPFNIKDPVLLDQIGKIIPFHGYLSTGAFIGLEMLNLAKKLLDINEGEKYLCDLRNKKLYSRSISNNLWIHHRKQWSKYP